MVGGHTCVTIHYLSVECETAAESETGKFADAMGAMGGMPVYYVYGFILTLFAADEICEYTGDGSIQSVGLVWNTVYFPRRRRVRLLMCTVV